MTSLPVTSRIYCVLLLSLQLKPIIKFDLRSAFSVMQKAHHWVDSNTPRDHERD